MCVWVGGGGSYHRYSLPSQDGGGGEVTALEGEFLGRQSLVVGDVTTAAIVQQRADDLQHVTLENQASTRAPKWQHVTWENQAATRAPNWQHVTWENQAATRAPSWQLLHRVQELREIRSCVRSGAV